MANPTASGQSAHPLPRALWVAVLMSPLLGWLSALVVLCLAVKGLMTQGLRASCAHLGQGAARWLFLTVLFWWLVLLLGDLAATPSVPWWQDSRFLLVIVPPLLLMPQFQRCQITYRQVGHWASWSVWITATAIALEYLVAVQWAGMEHHRPRALSGNALFVSVMLVPMMMLCWLGATNGSRWAWVRPVATHVLGMVCLAGLLGARASTVIAIGLLPMALLWQRRVWGVSSARIITGTLLALAAAVLFLLPAMSGWYEQRWNALLRVLAGQDPSGLGDYGIATRALHWPAAWQAIVDRPWLGHGFLNETATLQQYLAPGSVVLPTAHQQFLSFMLWSGVPGLVTGFALMALPVLLAVIRQRGPRGVFAAFAISLPLMLNGLFDTVLDDLRIVSHYLMLVVLVDAVIEERGSPPVQGPT
jgi:O-antigen ligase